MELGITDRIMLFSLLPSETNFKTYQTVRAMRNILSLTDEERAAINLRNAVTVTDCPHCGKRVEIADPSHTVWDQAEAEARGTTNLIITSEGLAVIKEALEKLNSASKLTPPFAELYERFQNVKAEVVEKGK